MRLLQETLSKTSYFQKLIPYLSHMSDEQLLQLPFNHFQGHGEIDTIFRTFYAQHIVVLQRVDERIAELENYSITERLRRGTSFQQVLDEIRHIPRKEN